MTAAEMAQDRAVVDGATRGPWRVGRYSISGHALGCMKPSVLGMFNGELWVRENDRAFLEAARDRWPVALAETERLRCVLQTIASSEAAAKELRGAAVTAIGSACMGRGAERWVARAEAADVCAVAECGKAAVLRALALTYCIGHVREIGAALAEAVGQAPTCFGGSR